ncbi:MAG TPA: SH3 domain-containing protein [Flavilitoribacter sp.]|nr:SH3 domain-containing protein [Flavilitoribacter sp.]HMQ86667.1 SH3 domain-containing protein [Flavilitoribacter sp.]
MIVHRKSVLLPLLFLVAACSHTPDPKDQADLTTVRDGVVLRDAPSLDGKSLKELPQNTPLRDLGQVSDNLTHLEFQGREFDQPWIKVGGPDSLEAWVYGADVAPIGADSAAVGRFREDKTLQSLLGAGLLDSLGHFNRSYEQISSAAGLAAAYREGDSLRQAISNTFGARLTTMPVPDITFIRERIHAYQPLLVAEGTAWYLFNDYSQWLTTAKKTPEPEDDAFIEVMIACFPEDSIEYFYPVWFLQTWDYGGESLLGQGHHFQLLEKADALFAKTTLFHPELNDLKNRLLNDITDVNVSYWEDAPTIRQELDKILNRKWSVLSEADLGVIRIRRAQFDEPDKNGIRYNNRSGEE